MLLTLWKQFGKFQSFGTVVERSASRFLFFPVKTRRNDGTASAMYLVAWEGSVHQMHHSPVSAAVADAMLVVVAKYKSVIKKKRKKFLIRHNQHISTFYFLK